jgi:hypothetical protein
MITRRVVTSDNPVLADVQWPVFEARGRRDGPVPAPFGVFGCKSEFLIKAGGRTLSTRPGPAGPAAQRPGRSSCPIAMLCAEKPSCPRP